MLLRELSRWYPPLAVAWLSSDRALHVSSFNNNLAELGNEMELFHGLDKERWKKLGFHFYGGSKSNEQTYHYATAKFGEHTLNLQISERMIIARVDNDETGDTERHAVFEEEAIEWFCRVSPDFAHAYKNLSPAPL